MSLVSEPIEKIGFSCGIIKSQQRSTVDKKSTKKSNRKSTRSTVNKISIKIQTKTQLIVKTKNESNKMKQKFEIEIKRTNYLQDRSQHQLSISTAAFEQNRKNKLFEFSLNLTFVNMNLSEQEKICCCRLCLRQCVGIFALG